MKLIDDNGNTIAESTHVHVGWNPAQKAVKVALLTGGDEEANIPVTIVIPVDELDQLLPELAIAFNELRHIERASHRSTEMLVSITAPGGDFLNALAADLYRQAMANQLPDRKDPQAPADEHPHTFGQAGPVNNEKAAGFGGGAGYDGRHG